ncbi:unnamed protein product [Timema podura]|uniref:UDP-glucuronosyltransferase n=1 Tax=Timema podura TaxID=61482 RepID=A0ABN7NSW2_TIMPD|nr:unnamed protein product [Timema podura]
MNSMTYAARILGVFPITSSSHQIVYHAIMKELAQRGHELVVITPYPVRDPSLKNYTEIDVSFMNKAWQNRFNFVEGRSGKITANEMMVKQQDFGGFLCELMLSHPQVKKLISSQENDQHFDLMFLEMVLTPGIFGFIHRFPVPSIGITSFQAFSINYDSVGNPNLPAYAPEVFLPYSDRKTFFERVHSMFFLLWLKYHFYYNVIPTQDAIARKHFGESMPYLGDLHFKPSMLFVTNDFIFHSPTPNVPAVVQLSGLHINSPKPLPQLAKWMPQQDVLRHPKMKAFISQGGLQSAEEAILMGVPLIGIPFFADQDLNVKMIVERGIGLKIEFTEVTKENVLKSLKSIIYDNRFRENIKKLSVLREDMPDKPLERAVWWTEYVLRHKGAPHLRTAAVDMPWYHFLLLDVIAFLLLTAITVLLVLYLFIRKLYHSIQSFIGKKRKLE